jgi:hypothetical protein
MLLSNFISIKNRIYDVLYDPKNTYMILEFCGDGDLDKFI